MKRTKQLSLFTEEQMWTMYKPKWGRGKKETSIIAGDTIKTTFADGSVLYTKLKELDWTHTITRNL